MRIADLVEQLAPYRRDHPVMSQAAALCRLTRSKGRRVIFIGNGGSAAIASHAAADWQKNGGFKTICFNDAAQLTALANDHGYENVFAYPIKMHGQRDDLLIAVSSSGESPNILKAVRAAAYASMKVMTFSGFKRTNTLGRCGEVNFHIDSLDYGVVETAHLALLHALLDACHDQG